MILEAVKSGKKETLVFDQQESKYFKPIYVLFV